MKFSVKNFFSKCDQFLDGKLHFLCSICDYGKQDYGKHPRKLLIKCPTLLKLPFVNLPPTFFYGNLQIVLGQNSERIIQKNYVLAYDTADKDHVKVL